MRSSQFLVICSIYFLALLPAKAQQELVPLDSVIRVWKTDGDINRLTYVFVRCSSLNTVASALLMQNHQKNTSDQFLQIASHYFDLALATSKTVDETRSERAAERKSDNQLIKELRVSLKLVYEMYESRMKKNYAASGNYFLSDEFLKREIELCKDPIKMVTILGF